jgi:hypothetical protein
MFRSALTVGRAFDEHVPIRGGEILKPRFQLRRILQLRPLIFQPQLPVSNQPPKSLDVVIAEHMPQLFVVHQERFAATWLRRMATGDPTLSIERRTAAGHQRVDVGMVILPLVSRVKHQLRGWLELPTAAERFIERSPSGVKEQAVKGLAIAQDQAGQPIGQREDHLEVVDLGQHQLTGLVEPIRSPSTTTLGAVAIDARVVDIPP